MTNIHIQPKPGAPIACDMSTAADTPDERLAEYGRLFERALVRRERRGTRVVFGFRAAAARGRRWRISLAAKRPAARSWTTASRRSATR